ncbi:MAG: DUF1493 family protein [Pseudomonadota bacterium]
MSLRQEILDLAELHGGKPRSGVDDGDVLGSFDLDGDNATDFLEAFCERFNTDLSTMQWEYHFEASEPPPSYRKELPIAKDGSVIPFHPITLDDLEKAARSGRWEYEYPDYDTKIFWLYRPWIWITLFVAVFGGLNTFLFLAE